MSIIRQLTCIAVILAAWSLDLLVGVAQAADKRPNVVFVLVDDLRYNALGCTGHPFAKTPNIDRLAKEGANFTNAFVTLSLCSPSRACFLTGRYAHSHGVIDNKGHNELSHQLITFPRLLHDAGYETAYIGKWHMGNDDSPRPGFDRWVSFKGQGMYNDPSMNVDGQPVKRAGYMTDILNDEAVAFLSTRREKPFALYLAHKAVHGPFAPAERHQELYADARIEPTPSARDTLEGKPVLRRDGIDSGKKNKAAKKQARDPTDTPEGDDALSHAKTVKSQLRCVASIDEGLGRILDTLEKAGQLDNTMVIFTSDNGYFWGDHGLGDKRAAYEPSIRIPMLMRYPPLVRAGSRVEQMALNIDVAPTLLALVGLPIPAEVEGRSLLPLLRGDTANWRTSFFCEYFQEGNNPRVPTWQGLRTERWKLIHYPDFTDMDELYDLMADPNEMTNLISRPEAQSILPMLRAELARAVAAK